MREESSTSIRRAASWLLLCLICFPLAGCAQSGAQKSSIVVCDDDRHAAYPDVAAQILPAFTVNVAGNRAFHYLEAGAVTEAFGPQAVSALDAGVAKHWYPQYLATVVIAIDRDRSDARIGTWSDLPTAREAVGVSDSIGSNPHVVNNMTMAAISYGLEGEGFTLKKATELLAGLRAENRLERNLFDSPIAICYDFQAADLILSGRNLEIIVPVEGTYAYEKGLLSNDELIFSGDVDALLLAQGLRLVDGRGDSAAYPGAEAYESAAPVKDYEHFFTVSQGATLAVRQDILRSKLLSSKDDRQHQLFALIYLVVVVMWLAAVVHRTAQRNVRSAALITGIILIGWMAVRLLRYQLPVADGVTRYMWYSYTLFELALPLVALWMAWAIDKPDNNSPPNWLRLLAVICGALAILAFTSDYHGFVYQIDLSKPDWQSDYGYGFGFALKRIAFYAPMVAAIAIMLFKSARNPRKKGRVLPIAFVSILALYSYGYSAGIPLARESDMTMVAGLFTLLFFESAMRTGMIPVNTKYPALFASSPLSMQIVDSANNTVLSAARGLPRFGGDDALRFSAEIPGGTVLWQEDISGLNRLHAEVEESVRSLAAANALLAEDVRINRAVQEEIAKTQLLTQLENEITRYMVKFSDMTGKLNDSADQQEDTARAATLLCYIKQRCNLFFRERESAALGADELRAYMDELGELAGHSGVNVIVTNETKAQIPVRSATLLYDLFYRAIEWAAGVGSPNMLSSLVAENGNVELRLLPSRDARSFPMDERLRAAIAQALGTYDVADFGYAYGICLAFPEGGEEK